MNSTLKLLEERLYVCAKRAFTKIISQFSDEGIYCLGLYTSGGLEYLTTTCSTCEGLGQVAKKYQHKIDYANLSLEQLRERLKWNPCDSPRHLACEEEIDVSDLMWQLS